MRDRTHGRPRRETLGCRVEAVAWIGIGEYARVVGWLMRTYREDPDLRDLIRGELGTPRDVTNHLGAGLDVGEVPSR